MHKKFMIVFLVLILNSLQQFGMFRQAATILSEKLAFTPEFCSLTSRMPGRSVFEIRLFSQIPLDRNLENRIFRLITEEEADVSVMLSKDAAVVQFETVEEMQKEGIKVGIVPDEYCFINWQARYAKDKTLAGFKLSSNKNIRSLMTAALISYEPDETVMLLGKPNETLCMHNRHEFGTWQRRFDCLLAKSILKLV